YCPVFPAPGGAGTEAIGLPALTVPGRDAITRPPRGPGSGANRPRRDGGGRPGKARPVRARQATPRSARMRSPSRMGTHDSRPNYADVGAGTGQGAANPPHRWTKVDDPAAVAVVAAHE